MAKILLLSVDRVLAESISDAMGQRASVSLVQAIDPEQVNGPCLIVLDRSAIPPTRSLSTAIATIAGNAPESPVVVTMDRQEPSEILAAVRAGAADVLQRNAPTEEISVVLGRLLNSTVVGHSKRGEFTLILSVDHEAAAIAATDIALTKCADTSSVLLVDCTLPTSACEAYLDLKVTYGIASAVADIERLDLSLLNSTLAKDQKSGLMLLTFDGGTGTEPVGLSPSDIAALMRLLKASCDRIVFCAGSLRNSSLLNELASMAERIEIVCTQSIRELEATRRMLDRINPDAATLDRSRLLMWDHKAAVLLDGRRMSDVLNVRSSIGVPVDQVQMRNALNSGRPIALETSAGSYMQVIRRLAGVANKGATSVPVRFPKWLFNLTGRLRAYK